MRAVENIRGGLRPWIIVRSDCSLLLEDICSRAFGEFVRSIHLIGINPYAIRSTGGVWTAERTVVFVLLRSLVDYLSSPLPGRCCPL